MNKYTATVIKTGNSYALRVPKAYIEATDLALGNKVDLPLVRANLPQDEKTTADLWQQLRKVDPFADIADPMAWQREIREDREVRA